MLINIQLCDLSLAADEGRLAAFGDVEDRLLAPDEDHLASCAADTEGLALDGEGVTVHLECGLAREDREGIFYARFTAIGLDEPFLLYHIRLFLFYYQILIRSSGAIYILSASVTPNVEYHSAKFLGGIFARRMQGP